MLHRRQFFPSQYYSETVIGLMAAHQKSTENNQKNMLTKIKIIILTTQRTYLQTIINKRTIHQIKSITMSVESYLTRRLDIRFIDARSIVTEAKVNLSIHGYPTKEQEMKIRSEACRVYCNRSDANRETMRRLSNSLEAIKMSKGSMHSGDMSCCSASSSFGDDDAHSFADSAASTGTTGTKRSLSLFRKQRSRC